MDNHFQSINHGVTIESYFLHQFESYVEPLSFIIILCSLREKGRLNIDFEIGISILFDEVRNKLVSNLTSNVLNATDENHKHCIF